MSYTDIITNSFSLNTYKWDLGVIVSDLINHSFKLKQRLLGTNWGWGPLVSGGESGG